MGFDWWKHLQIRKLLVKRKGIKTQNVSHTVMAQRIEAADSLDNFPTPPWATRAFMEHVISEKGPFDSRSCLEPACGAGQMAEPLKECFGEVFAKDIHGYGYGQITDFLNAPLRASSVDWLITNPPFRLAEQFIMRALMAARCGVAMLTRTVFIESVGRYERLFERNPPTCVRRQP